MYTHVTQPAVAIEHSSVLLPTPHVIRRYLITAICQIPSRTQQIIPSRAGRPSSRVRSADPECKPHEGCRADGMSGFKKIAATRSSTSGGSETRPACLSR